MPTPADSIEEFKVGTNNQTADFNSSAGAQMQMVTKRGQINGTERHTNIIWITTGRPTVSTTPMTQRPQNPATTTTDLAVPSAVRSRKKSLVESGTFSPIMRVSAGRLCHRHEGGSVRGDGLGTAPIWRDGLQPQPEATLYPSRPAVVPDSRHRVSGFGRTRDPLGLGISPTLQALWQYMPASNISSCAGLTRCDHLNILAFRANMAAAVGRQLWRSSPRPRLWSQVALLLDLPLLQHAARHHQPDRHRRLFPWR